MKILSKLTAGIAAVVLFSVAQSNAQITNNIVFYAFDSNTTFAVNTAAWSNAVVTATVGSSISSFSNFNTGSGSPFTVLSSVSGNGNNHGFLASNSVGQNGWVGDGSYFQFTLDSTGYQDLIVGWAGNRSGTGPTNIVFRYSSTGTGGTFSDIATFPALANSSTNFNLTSITALNNNPNVVFRIYGVDVSSSGGTLKLDNFSVDAIIPEPSTMVLVGLGLVAMLASRRRR